MSSERTGFDRRVEQLHKVCVGNDSLTVSAFAAQAKSENGTIEGAITTWDEGLHSPNAKTLRLLNALIDVTDNNTDLAREIRANQPQAQSMRQLALGLGKADLERLAGSASKSPAGAIAQESISALASESSSSSVRKAAVAVRQALFRLEPTAVLQRMVMDDEIPVSAEAKRHVATVLDEYPEFDIRTTPISSILVTSTSFKDLPDATRSLVASDLRTLQRVQSLSPVPDAIPILFERKFTSALHISHIPEDKFVRVLSSSLGGDVAVATSIHRHATHSRVRNENFLISSLQAIRGSGLRVIDGGAGKQGVESRMTSFGDVASQVKSQVNLERLFGTLDYCECPDCNSVYSPAAYFVELLEFLRHNNLGHENSHVGSKTLKGTQLEQLLLRRPDLQCLQLTCENTNTLIPYIDLALEVMESYVVHAPLITAYNVNSETSSELLCQPQHTNREAYAILRDAVYPLALPYNFAIDTMRTFFSFLNTSRAEMLRVFQPEFARGSPTTNPTAAHETAQRAADSEYNLITQEEYVILTHQEFLPPPSSNRSCSQPCSCPGCTHSTTKYDDKIHVREPWELFGYKSRTDMLDDGDKPKSGLTWVKNQFLPRTSILYTELVSLLTTRYVNPAMPTGSALTTMMKLRFSYRFLSYLVQKKYTDKRRRFALLIRFLCLAQPLIPLVEWAKKKADPCEVSSEGADSCGCDSTSSALKKNADRSCCCCCYGDSEWRTWVYKYFEKIGAVIVLESGEGPRLEIQGRMWALPRGRETVMAEKTEPSTSVQLPKLKPVFVGALQHDGGIIKDGDAIGFVSVDARVIDLKTGKLLSDTWDDYRLFVYQSDPGNGEHAVELGYVRGGILMVENYSTEETRPARYSPTQDTCDIEKVRLMHLDGSPVEPVEYEKMVRLLRLARKMGWSVLEADDAIAGLGKPLSSTSEQRSGSSGNQCPTTDAGEDEEDEDAQGSGATSAVGDITPDLIHQLVAVKKLLDHTGFPLSVLLTFWADIPHHGEKSLYEKTFLTHNLMRMDPVFVADGDGNFLTGDEKISDHLSVLSAGLRLKDEEIGIVRTVRSIPDKLTLSTVSELFRVAKLMKFLNVRISYLSDVLTLFGNPFASADSTLELLETWQGMLDAGFTLPQLIYIIRGVDNLAHPMAPSIPQVLLLSKTLYDSLNDIDKQNPDITQADIDNNAVSLADIAPAKLALVYDSALAARINSLIAGEFVATTNAPSGLTFLGGLPEKAKYVDKKDAKPPTAQLVVTGILTDDEMAAAIGLSPNPLWALALQRIKKQSLTFYNQILAGLLPADGATIMLKGDTATTPTEKGLYFMKYFTPFLRSQLATKLVQTTVSDSTGLDLKMTSYLCAVVRSSSGQSALDALLALKQSGSAESPAWRGYLIPKSTDNITFVVASDTQPPPMSINGKSVAFPHQSEDPNNIWSSDPQSMVAGSLYEVQLADRTPEQLSWSTQTSPPSQIPSTSLLPALASDTVQDVLGKLARVSVLIQGFGLSLDEVAFFHEHGGDFTSEWDGKALEIDAITLGTWKRLLAYTQLKAKLPKQPTRLIDLFAWASLPESKDVVSEINKVTLWDAEKVTKLLTGYDALDPVNFKNERVLAKLRTALDFVSKTQIDIPSLFKWAKPPTLSAASYKRLENQAEALKNALRARYSADDWEQAAKPLFDTLRKNQRDALVAYLVVEESLVKTGLVKDADGLFEYFLIDCQMSACLETSRIKQAISSLQLYVQRILLGLEVDVATKDADHISRDRWDWMKRFRVWEANRKVFLYPENWIEPSLRDDKTPNFLEFESQMHQKDVSMANATESLKEYIYGVAAVANMKVYGLFILGDAAVAGKFGVNLVARRMNAPFDWYSRGYSSDGKWSPWVRMPVDIPNYEVDDDDGNSLGSGAYVCPVMWQGQPIVFFLQMLQKQIPHKADRKQTMMKRLESEDEDSGKPRPMWEIRLGYTVYQNGKWSQKQLSHDSLRHKAKLIQIWDPKNQAGDDQTKWGKLDTYPVPNLTGYQMYPRTVSDSELRIDVVYRDWLYNAVGGSTETDNENIGYFLFTNGGVARKVDGSTGTSVGAVTDFQYTMVGSLAEIHSFQAADGGSVPPRFSLTPMVQYDRWPAANSKSKIVLTDKTQFTFNHTFVDPLLKDITAAPIESSSLKTFYGSFAALARAADSAGDDPFGYVQEKKSYGELMSPYGIYNWEIGLHAPMTIIDGLLKAQQFDAALEMCHQVFDPSAVGAASDPSGDNGRYWKFLPFKKLANADAKETLEQMFLQLQPQAPDDDITDWRDHPFSPHSIARNRPVAYMKWIAMKYIEILLAYGDYYFRQNSLETIPNAIQCYVLASHVYGPRGQKIPRRGKTKPETYASLLNRWDAFGNAVVQLEVEFPFSNQTSLPIGSSNGITGFANIFGFATSLYFGIPGNPKLQELRDTIDDRLSKIRNCMDINGVVRHLALWDPPIDPALLVQATAQGLSIDTVLDDLSGPMPNYRFQLILQKAFEMCAELKSLAAGLLAAKEKRDGEALAILRASHETVMSNLSADIRTRQLGEANAVLEQLLHSRKAPSYKMQFFKFLVGLTDAAPGEKDDFNEIPNTTLALPNTEGDLLLNEPEQEEVQSSLTAQNWGIGVGSVEALAAVFHAIPSTEAAAKPWGVGAGLVWGGVNLGHTSAAIARGLAIYEKYLRDSSANAGRKAALLRQLQDRVFQANSLGLELKNIDKSIASQRLRVSTAEREIKNSEKALEQVTAVEAFLRTKYTNGELYAWIEGTTKSLYQQSYNFAFDLAKRAEKAFRFERPQMGNTEFIKMGYWTNARDGLLAGEQLFLGLKRLEAAYQENLGYDFEVTKHVSVRQWAPLALVDFRETGTFEISLPEILFDMDCPGHYMRRLKSVAVTIPAIVGPYTPVNCTIRLLSHSTRTTPRASGKADYPRLEDEDDDRFATWRAPITSIALSSAQNDSGRHELSLTDRYNPFEGAGAISRWRFQLPADLRAFDYASISDVVMHLRYTALDGGDRLRDIASGAVADYVKNAEDGSRDTGGLFMLFDVRAEFAAEWQAAFGAAAGTKPVRELKLRELYARLPVFTRRTKPQRIVATMVVLLGRGTLVPAEVSLEIADGSQDATFKPSSGIQGSDLVGLTSDGLQMPMTDWVLKVGGTSVAVERLWMVVKYALT